MMRTVLRIGFVWLLAGCSGNAVVNDPKPDDAEPAATSLASQPPHPLHHRAVEFLVIDVANEPIRCSYPKIPKQTGYSEEGSEPEGPCRPSWQITIALPVEFQRPGTYDLSSRSRRGNGRGQPLSIIAGERRRQHVADSAVQLRDFRAHLCGAVTRIARCAGAPREAPGGQLGVVQLAEMILRRDQRG
jgi:hypothetical protein